jgi:hypothetical protein
MFLRLMLLVLATMTLPALTCVQDEVPPWQK